LVVLRKLVAAAVVLFLGVGYLMAEEFNGKVKSYDGAKGVLTITYKNGDDSVDKEFDTRSGGFYSGNKALKAKAVPKALVKGADVTVNTKEKDGKTVEKDGRAVAEKVTIK
jgi:aconitase A